MSLNHLLSQVSPNAWANPRFNSVAVDNGLNMMNSDILNVDEINGVPFSNIDVKNEIIWNSSQLLPKIKNSYRDWSGVISVKSAIAELNGCVTIYCDDTSPLIIDSSTDCQSRVILSSAVCRGGGLFTQVLIADGVVLTNLYGLCNDLQLRSSATLIEPLSFLNNACFRLCDGANLYLEALATKSFINLVNSALTMPMFRFARLDNTAVPALPIIQLDATSTLIMLRAVSSICTNDSISGPIGAQFVDLRDSSSLAFTNAGFLGTFSPLDIDHADQVFYDDSKVAPPLGSNQVQGAIDALKLSGSGDVSFAGAPPVVNEIACFANIDGKSIHASSVGGAICSGNLDASGFDLKSATCNITTINGASCNVTAVNATNVFSVNGNYTVSLTSGDLTLGNQVQAIRALTAPVALADSAWTAIDYSSSINMNGITYGAPQYTLPASSGGTYYVGATMTYSANATGWRGIRIYNVTQNRYYCQQASLSLGAVDDSLLSCGQVILLNAGDVLEIQCYQNSGAPLNIGFGGASLAYSNIIRLY